MDYPIVVFMDDENTYRVLVPDFGDLSFTCSSLDDAFEKAKKAIEEKIYALKAQGQSIPLASLREQYVTRYLDAVLVNKVNVDSVTE
jgi:predicted RNase H-like HicB family nuclease